MHKPNVTVAAIVTCQDKFLLVKERDKHTGDICYNQPAGHLEANETLAEAAHRELIEETGISLNASHLVGIYNLHAANGVHYMRFSFAFNSPELFEPSPKMMTFLAQIGLALSKLKACRLEALWF